MEQKTQKKVATKKVAAEKPAAAKPAKASGVDKLSRPTRIIGYVAFGMLLLGFVVAVVGLVLLDKDNDNVAAAFIGIGAFFAVVSQLLGLATGIMLLVKSKKVDTDAKIKKANFIMGICAIVGSGILMIGGILYAVGVDSAGTIFAVLGLLFATVTILVASIRSTLQFKKAKKPAQKPAAAAK